MTTRKQGQIIFTVIGILLSLIWLITDISWQPIIILIGLIALLFSLLYSDKIKFNKNKAKRITLMIAVSYFIIGNFVGYFVSIQAIKFDSILSYIFVPYTFNWFLSAFAGGDMLTIVFEVMAFVLSLFIFFPIGLYFSKPTKI
jgi:hypothetical protein